MGLGLTKALGADGAHWSNKERAQIERAWALRQAHTLEEQPLWGNARESDELCLLRLFTRLHLAPEAACAGLLVAPVAERLLEISTIEAELGKDVARLCQKVASLPSFSFSQGRERKERNRHREQVQAQAESFRRMLLAISQDLRVVLLHLAIRVHQLRFLGFVPVEQQRVIAREGREICAPLANRLGISWLKNEFEDLSLRFLYPYDYYRLASQLSSKRGQRDAYIKEVKALLHELLAGHGIQADVKGRSKHLNSIYRKLENRGIGFEQLYDITAFRVICQTQEQCYQILGLLHARWTPVPGRFKDYIALPKSNQYQSLHTTVVGPQNKRMEVQVRTLEMDRIAEDGIAAHWLYKEGGNDAKAEPGEEGVSEVQWLRSLLHLQDEQGDALEFMANVQDHLFEEKVFAFTPKGDVRELMRGASPLDFAYAIHTEVGMRCMGAKVNNKMVALRYALKNGDMVEILTSPTAQPNLGQLEFARTGRARTKIRSFLRSTQRLEAIAQGRSRLEKGLPPSHRSINKLLKSGALAEAAEHYGLSTTDELLMQIGYGKLQVDAVVKVLFPSDQSAVVDDEEVVDLLEAPPKPKKSKGGILVDGMSDILVRMARCCNPIPGDPIVGFVSRGRAVSIHTAECPKGQELDEARQTEVSWDDSQTSVHTVTLRIITENRTGLLTQISKVFSDRNINITSARCQTLREQAVNLFQCQVSNIEQLRRLSQQLERIRGVERVERLRR